jgi:hypothetical protein
MQPFNIKGIVQNNPIHLIVFLGFLIRLSVVLASDQIHHPDEIFQYLEQAHRLEFGYGIIPWEYRYGMRSWLLPGLLSGPLHIMRVFHVDAPHIYIPAIKLLCCIFSLSLIYSSYFIVKNLASENAGRVAALFACFWYELVYYSSKPTPEVISTYCLLLALGYLTVNHEKKYSIMFGLFCALSAILRLQYVPLVFILLILAVIKWPKIEITKSILVIFSIFLVSGYLDYLTWGGYFASYYCNYLYNSVYHVSEIFGVKFRGYYFMTLAISSAGVFIFTGCISFARSLIKKTWLPLVFILFVILPHTLIAHKEARFIFATIPFLLMLMAILITELPMQLRSWNGNWGKCIKFSMFTLVFCISIAGFCGKLPFQKKIYKSMTSRNPILSAYLYLNGDSELFAILNTYSKWHDTGGYYYLHRNVPIYNAKHLAMISNEEYSFYISHIVCSKNDKTIKNYNTVFRSGDLEIRKSTLLPAKQRKLEVDTVNVPQKGIDDRFKPLVRAILH